MRRRSGESVLAVVAGRELRAARLTIGVSQRELERRTGVPQAATSRFERGRASSIGLADIELLVRAMGGRARLTLEFPFASQRVRQRDALHARCVGHVARRLQAAGWLVATEVQIDGRFGPGWIDVLAFDPRTRTLLVIEVKTEIDDLGQIQRTLGWYSSRAAAAAAARGWRSRSIRSVLLVLATEATDRRIVGNRPLLDAAFPARAAQLSSLIGDPISAPDLAGWAIAGIDPHHRGRAWLRPTGLDGRRRVQPYVDYADAWTRLEGGRRLAPR